MTMQAHRAFSRRRPAATRLLAATLLAVVAIGGCTQKGSDFFETIDPTPTLGAIIVRVTGTPASVRLTGNDLDETQGFGAIAGSFSDLEFGIYNLEVMPPSGFGCTPPSATAQITAASRFPEVVFACEPDPPDLAILTFLASGFTGSATYPLTLSGDVVRTGQFGASGVVFDMVPGGSSIDWMLDLTGADQQCDPNTGSATVPAGENVEVTISCEPLPGTVQVQVLGLGSGSASVGWVGAASGSGAFGAVVSDIPDLPAGSYTFTITDPVGFTCTPPNHQFALSAGATVLITFTCESLVAQPLVVDLQLNAAPNFGGQIMPSPFTLTLLDGGIPVGTINAETIGALHSAPGPDRFGGFGPVGIRLDVRPTVSGTDFNTVAIDICVLNSALTPGNPAHVTMRDPALVALGVADLGISPSCFNVMLPTGTRYVEITGPIGITYDFTGLRLHRN
jgi:hypothetical protein